MLPAALCASSASPVLLLTVLLGLVNRCIADLALSATRCNSACLNNGNCNFEEGRCECNLGYVGPNCNRHVFSACRTSNNSAALAFYGTEAPKNCHCWRQLLKWYANAPGSKMEIRLPSADSVKTYGVSKYCYERIGVPEDQQFSDTPLVNQSGIRWLRPQTFEPLDAPPQALKFGVAWNPSDEASLPDMMPLSQCPERCTDRGLCLGPRTGHQGKMATACLCQKGLKGAACNETDADKLACLNNCTAGRGECIAGFCRCPRGWFGMDCSRSRAFGSAANTTTLPRTSSSIQRSAHRSGLRIYRYELPWHIAFPYAPADGRNDYDQLYSAFEIFFNRLSSDWAVRTENPWEANLFYIPLLAFYLSGNAGDVHDNTRRVVEYIMSTYPLLWGRNKGKDHFMWLPGDLGACWLLDLPHVQNPIKIVHFGLQVARSNYTLMPGREHAQQNPIHPTYSCFNIKKDVVAPAVVQLNNDELPQAEYNFQAALGGSSRTRKHLLFFAGSVRVEQPEYSGGARQAFYKFVIKAGANATADEVKYGGSYRTFRESTFCFAPYGDGWGDRLIHMVLAACIPVIVQDHVHQPFDDLLPYAAFSLRLHNADVPQLLPTLRAISPEQIYLFRRALHRYYRAMVWQPEFGGLAYNYTLRSLQTRLHNLRGNQF